MPNAVMSVECIASAAVSFCIVLVVAPSLANNNNVEGGASEPFLESILAE